MIDENDPRWKVLLAKEPKKDKCQQCSQERWLAPIIMSVPKDFEKMLTGPFDPSLAREEWICRDCFDWVKDQQGIFDKIINGKVTNLPPELVEQAKNMIVYIDVEKAKEITTKYILSQQAKLEVKEMLEKC